ncbi:UMP kinase [Candidatus Berkelbacteria bacterium]|nr:UMP kinase [Candidatus Berkelbacteria bacterium]
MIRTYRRILLKISGEILRGEASESFDEAILERLATETKEIVDAGLELMIVVGGGNIFRHSTHAHHDMDRVTADYMGMLATIINGLALQSAFEHVGLKTRVMSAIRAEQVVEPYIRRRAIRHVEKGRVVVLVAGTGNPYFTTDSAAVLRASELGCDILLKGTKVDGIYTHDPKKDPTAERFNALSCTEVIERKLHVMDLTAFTMARDNQLPILVFDILTPGNAVRAAKGESIGTLVQP